MQRINELVDVGNNCIYPVLRGKKVVETCCTFLYIVCVHISDNLSFDCTSVLPEIVYDRPYVHQRAIILVLQ